MKFTTLLSPLSLLAILTPIPVNADGASITAALKSVEISTTQLGTSVSSWTGDILGALPILASGLSLLSTVEKATITAGQSAPLAFEETLGVATATTQLSNTVNVTLTALIAAKPMFDRTLLSPVILVNLGMQRKATNELSEAIVSKVPAELQATARDLVKPVDDGFEKAINAFQLF